MQNCAAEGALLVLRNDPDTVSNVNQVIGALGILAPSPQCLEEAIPFLCLYLYGGLCESSASSSSIRPTAGQCRNIRDTLCSSEWESGEAFGLDLPDCDSLPEEQVFCGDQSESGSGAVLNSSSGSFECLGNGVQECSVYQREWAINRSRQKRCSGGDDKVGISRILTQ